MTLGFSLIVYLCTVLIVAVGTHEETRVTSRYDYVEESCISLMPSQMMEANMSSQDGEGAPFRARFMNNNEDMYTYRPNHEYRSEWKIIVPNYMTTKVPMFHAP